jgi:hypothetical protein
MEEIAEKINLGRWNKEMLDTILREAATMRDIGRRIDFLSRQFLDVVYREGTLIGDIQNPEVLVIDLTGVDCFTYLDYVEAMRLSKSFKDFRGNVKRIRYRNGQVAFDRRNHFFTDWREVNTDLVDDVTEAIGGSSTVIVQKKLNEKADGTCFLPGIQSLHREVRYIPSAALDNHTITKLKTGDYAGVYSDMPGLDVSHVGIIIKDNEKILLRHASSRKEHRRVIDQELKEYVSDKPGIVLLRPRDM